jgi:hypothetical protein
MMYSVRTTVTLDADTELLVRRTMSERGITFKVALNDAIRQGLSQPRSATPAFRTPAASLGLPSVNLDRALVVASQLEDDELVRKQRLGK